MTENRPGGSPDEPMNNPPGGPTWGQQPAQPSQPWGQPAQPFGGQQPPYGAPQNPGTPQQPQQPQWVTGSSPQPGQYGSQNPNPYGPPGQQPGFGQPGQQPGFGQPGQQPGLGAPYGDPYGQPKKKSGAGRVILIVLIAVAVAVGGFFAYQAMTAPDLDRLYNQCASGSAEACEDLFQAARTGSSDEEFGKTCGGRTDGTVDCDSADMTAPANSWQSGGGSQTVDPETDEGDSDADADTDSDPGADSGEAEGAGGDEGIDGEDQYYYLLVTPLDIDDPDACKETMCEEGMTLGDNDRLDNLYEYCDSGHLGACDDLYNALGAG